MIMTLGGLAFSCSVVGVKDVFMTWCVRLGPCRCRLCDGHTDKNIEESAFARKYGVLQHADSDNHI